MPGCALVTDGSRAIGATIAERRLRTAQPSSSHTPFFALDDSSYITGIELFIDGGPAQILNLASLLKLKRMEAKTWQSKKWLCSDVG
jgi:hypothetical protein